MKSKIALITGITGQDGAYLAEFLLKKGYIVHGIKRKSSSINTERIDHLYQDSEINDRTFFLHYGDMTDTMCLSILINKICPDEIYNLAAQSHVQVSFEMPLYTSDVVALGTLRLLEAIRVYLKNNKTIKLYQASTSELYGKVQAIPQTEKTPFYPRSPYAVSKLYAYWMIINYREAYGLFACNGILFNHESPIRGETFVTRKITIAVSKIALGMQKKLCLGNLSAKRDWGHAKDYVEMMWLMLQEENPDDYVISTGVTTSVKDFVKSSFSYLGIDIEFKGSGLNEKGYVKKSNNLKYNLKEGTVVVEVDERYYRPTEVDLLVGDSSKAREKLGWLPKYSLDLLIEEMMKEDIKKIKKLQLISKYDD